MTALKTTRFDAGHAALAMFLAAGFALWLAPATSWAQKSGKSKADLARDKTEVNKVLRGEEPVNDTFEDYFKVFFLPQFVEPTVRGYSLDDLPKLRTELRNFFRTAKSGPPYDRLSDWTLEKMTKIILAGNHGDHDAAIKYNAVLVIGDLNEQEVDKPKPSAKAFMVLAKLLKWPKATDYMRVGVLVGMERHAAAGAIPPGSLADVTTLLVNLVNQQEPPAGRDPAAHQYLRRCAGEILALIGSPGPDNSVVKALASVAADPKARPTFRCEMAQYLGQLKYPPASKVDLQQLAKSLGQQAVDICMQEVEAAKAASRAPSRRMIVYALFSAKEAVGGGDGKGGLSSATAGTPAHKFIGNLYAKLKSLHTEFESSDSAGDLVDTEVSAKISDLEGVLAAASSGKDEQLTAAERKKEAKAAASAK